MTEIEEKLKSFISSVAQSCPTLCNFIVKLKKDSEKTGLKLSIQKTKIMASGPIISWQIEGEKVESVTDFISPCTVTEAMNLKDACSLEEKLWQT